MSSQKKLSNINFFIASTITDLRPYREEVIKAIRGKAGIINAQEFFGSRSQRALDTCLEEVRKSNVFILILGMKYGSIVSNTGKSYTEHEYEEAKKLNLLRLAYVIDENHPIPSVNVDKGDGAIKLDAFKKMLQDDLTVDKFTTSEDLSNKVIQDLMRELPKKEFLINEEAAERQQEVGLPHLINRFKTLPRIYYGREFEIIAKLKDFERATERECEAFSLTYGAALKRRIVPLDKKIDDLLGDELKTVYAGYDLSKLLLSYNSNSEVKLRVKTIQGIIQHRIPIYQQRHQPPHLVTVFSQAEMVVVDYEVKEELLIGLGLLEIID